MLEQKTRVLCIDDEDLIRSAVSDYLTDLGFVVNTAIDGEQGIEMFMAQRPDVVLVDLHMPKVDGYQVIKTVTKESPETPIIVISGTGVLQQAIEAIRMGAWDYIAKPIEDMIVLEYAVKRVLERAQLIRENRIYSTKLEEKVFQRTIELEKANKQLKQIVNEIVHALTVITEKKDPYTAGHQERVAILATSIAREMGFSQDECEGIKIAASLHDIGKIYVPAEFLAKPASLTEFEMKIIMEHATVGYEILQTIPFGWPIAEMVYQHHERLNGTGYPKGLKADQIRIQAKILSVADVVEAMSSHRPYRPALGLEIALKEIRKNQGILYDKDCVDACIRLFERKDKMLMSSFATYNK